MSAEIIQFPRRAAPPPLTLAARHALWRQALSVSHALPKKCQGCVVAAACRDLLGPPEK